MTHRVWPAWLHPGLLLLTPSLPPLNPIPVDVRDLGGVSLLKIPLSRRTHCLGSPGNKEQELEKQLSAELIPSRTWGSQPPWLLPAELPPGSRVLTSHAAEGSGALWLVGWARTCDNAPPGEQEHLKRKLPKLENKKRGL